MRTNQRAVIFSAAFSAAFCALGIGGLVLKAAPPKDARAGKNVPAKTAPAKIMPGKNAPTALSGVSTKFAFSLPDPKRPGKPLYELRADSLNGSLQDGRISGTLNSVWARLYQNGSPGAVLTAPHAHGGDAAKSITVTGTDGVVVKSLTEPGTKMTADTMVWYAGTNKIVATGHVFYRNGKNGATMQAPRMEANTGLKTIYITGGGHAAVAL